MDGACSACRLDPCFSWRRYWNYLRRQLFVMDTWAGDTNRRINHTMMVAHSYLSWAFTVPATTGRWHALQLALLGSQLWQWAPHSACGSLGSYVCLHCRQGRALLALHLPMILILINLAAPIVTCRRHALFDLRRSALLPVHGSLLCPLPEEVTQAWRVASTAACQGAFLPSRHRPRLCAAAVATHTASCGTLLQECACAYRRFL